MIDVITFGSATVDVFANTCNNVSDICHNEYMCYPMGTKILIEHLNFTTGGGGTNTAVAFSRLGLKTAYLGNLGNDENGNKVISELKKEKVSFIGTRDNSCTNYSLILDAEGVDRVILAYKESSHNLFWKKIDKKKLKAKWFYSSSLMGEAFKTLKNVVSYANKNNIKVAFNPSEYQVKKGNALVRGILPDIDLLVFNKEEAIELLKKKTATIEVLLKTLYNMGPNIVIITCGKEGAYTFDGEYIYYVKPPKIKVVETTGAGDAFASSFLATYIKTGNISRSMQIAQANASSVITYYGAKGRLLTSRKALNSIKKLKIKVTKKRM